MLADGRPRPQRLVGPNADGIPNAELRDRGQKAHRGKDRKGTVRSTPAGIACGADCSEIYAAKTAKATATFVRG